MTVTENIAVFAEFLARLILQIRAFIDLLRSLGGNKEETEQGMDAEQ